MPLWASWVSFISDFSFGYDFLIRVFYLSLLRLLFGIFSFFSFFFFQPFTLIMIELCLDFVFAFFITTLFMYLIGRYFFPHSLLSQIFVVSLAFVLVLRLFYYSLFTVFSPSSVIGVFPVIIAFRYYCISYFYAMVISQIKTLLFPKYTPPPPPLIYTLRKVNSIYYVI